MIALFAVIFCVSCEVNEYWYFSFINDSSKTISFTFSGSDYLIEPAEKKEIEVKSSGKSKNGIENIDAGSPYGYEISVKLESGSTHTGMKYRFYDVLPHNLNVLNTLPVPVTIKAGNYIDNSGLFELTIDAHADDNDAIIYTNKPSFTTVLFDYPVLITWSFKDNTVFVIIK